MTIARIGNLVIHEGQSLYPLKKRERMIKAFRLVVKELSR